MTGKKKNKYIIVVIIALVVALLPLSCRPAQYTLSTLAIPEGGGTVSPASGLYDAGTEVILNAEPARGYRFDYWSGDTTGTSNPISLIIDSEKNVTAHFKAQYSLKISAIPEGGGTVSPASGIYDAGTEVTFTAEPAQGYNFDYWNGDTPGNTSSTTIHGHIHMESDKNVIAHFVPRYTPEEIDQLTAQLGSSQEEIRLKASEELGELGSIISERQVGKILNIMRTGKQSWTTGSWRESHCTWYETTTIKYYAASALVTMKSPYVTEQIVNEAKGVKSGAKSTRRVFDPGWI